MELMPGGGGGGRGGEGGGGGAKSPLEPFHHGDHQIVYGNSKSHFGPDASQ